MTLMSCKDEKSNPVATSEPEIDVPAGWKLVWNDEFNGTAIDPSKWEHEVNAKGGGNNELQYYTNLPANSYIENGNLVIQARKVIYTGPEGTRNYTSARLRTKNRGDWKYGRFEIRASLPDGKGIWPAIWMLPTDWVYGGWAASGEIDIVELQGQVPNTIYGTIHFGGEYPRNTFTGHTYSLQFGHFANSFHVYALEWEATEIRWYVDGVQYFKANSWHSENGKFPAPFDQRFHLLLNVAVGGHFVGDPDATTQFPKKMLVDYVRVFEKLEN